LLQPGLLLPLMKESRGGRQIPSNGSPSPKLLSDKPARPKITIDPTITRRVLLPLLLLLLLLLLRLGMGLLGLLLLLLPLLLLLQKE